MKRINIYEENDEQGSSQFAGWFNEDSATVIAKYDEGDLYRNGKTLRATAKGKLVVNSWNNQGYDSYRFAKNESEIAEILSKGGYGGDDTKLMTILEKYEL